MESRKEKSSGSLLCEQPSPVSVLNGPFRSHEDQELDISSPPPTHHGSTTNLEPQFKDMCNDDRTGKVTNLLQCAENVTRVESHDIAIKLGIRSPKESAHNKDFEYINELLGRAIVVKGESTVGPKAFHEACKLVPLKPQLFGVLEEGSSPRMLASSTKSTGQEDMRRNDACSGAMYQRRRLLFDVVNTRLRSKMGKWLVLQNHPWILACEDGLNKRLLGSSHVLNHFLIQSLDEHNNLCLSKEGAKVLKKEVWEAVFPNNNAGNNEVDHVVLGEDENGGTKLIKDGINDCVRHLIETDILRERVVNGTSGDWCDMEELNVEKGKISHDIERLIFKDLIGHILRDLGCMPSSLSSSSFTKRQLFN